MICTASDYGVHLTENQAVAFRDRFFEAYPGLREWQYRQRNGIGETRTVLGRRRLDVTRFTERLNSPIQGSAADGLKAALALIWETRERAPSASSHERRRDGSDLQDHLRTG
jgi:DNA polymerase-1